MPTGVYNRQTKKPKPAVKRNNETKAEFRIRIITNLHERETDVGPVTMEKHLRNLAAIRDISLEDGSYATALAAEKARGQIAGFYIERKEVIHGKMDQMSSTDIVSEIKKLILEYPELQAILGAPKPVLELEYEEVDREGSVDTPTSADEEFSSLDKNRE